MLEGFQEYHKTSFPEIAVVSSRAGRCDKLILPGKARTAFIMGLPDIPA